MSGLARIGRDAVSIHSRLFKPGEYQIVEKVYAEAVVSIHSRLFKPGESNHTTTATAGEMFQSTPDYLNRENAGYLHLVAVADRVSIHSRLFKPGEWQPYRLE